MVKTPNQTLNTKEQFRLLCKNKLATNRQHFGIWSHKIWLNVQELLGSFDTCSSIKVGSYYPMEDEPILPVQPRFSYPQIISKTQMSYGNLVPDLLLIPGLAFTSSVPIYRLGRGKAYFDRFLSEHPECYTVGIAFECQVESTLTWNPDPWDIPLKELITESRRIKS